MPCNSKLEWHVRHIWLMLCGVLLGSSIGHVLHTLFSLDMAFAKAVASCACIALAHWSASQTPYRGTNWF